MADETAQAVEWVVSNLVEQTLAPFPSHPQRPAMLRETAVFERLHPQLTMDYLGQYVAITKGKLVDHDADGVALLHRIREAYPNQVVLCRKVEETAAIELHFRSPVLSMSHFLLEYSDAYLPARPCVRGGRRWLHTPCPPTPHRSARYRS
ncbi:MAG: hypothetical protein IPL28_04315 [Chloroflexi bacterium]|nr:hypothetical protein [Chloroflexota bacterium]